MQAWRIVAGSKIEGLKRTALARAELQPTQVRVRTHAATLNFRDLMIVNGWYPLASDREIIPGSDAAGTITEVGSEVTRWRPGDRVATTFFPRWIEGQATPDKIGDALGGGGDGVFAEELVLSENQFVRVPAHLNDAQAATLTCAGVTAWHALFVAGQTRPGDTVLLLGTGGVSIWALQLAKAAGARVIITSSSDAKLEHAVKLGADATINYKNVPDWHVEARRLTDGAGADLVLEVGGSKTVMQSIAATRIAGTVAIIGAVSGPGGAIDPMMLIGGSTRLQGIYVGSRQMHEDLARFVEVAKIAPVVDRV
ncbi:MAG: NAD(P)-dependent alcohol dehydrogenase, partial [Pseudomonadota bacterium]